MRRSAYGLLVLALVFATKLHLPILQVVAWAGMLVSYSQDRGVVAAVEMTFDGDHPCPLCCAIEKEQQSPSTHELGRPAAAPDLLLFAETAEVRITDSPSRTLTVPGVASPSAPIHRPPVPPPRTRA